jgi:very-short-patch-repair endonuclease
MRRQVDCSGDDGWIGRVDFRDTVAPLVVEIQSERFHRGLTRERSDDERLARLAASGLEVVEITDVELFQRPHEVLAKVDAGRARALARRAA